MVRIAVAVSRIGDRASAITVSASIAVCASEAMCASEATFAGIAVANSITMTPTTVTIMVVAVAQRMADVCGTDERRTVGVCRGSSTSTIVATWIANVVAALRRNHAQSERQSC